MIFFMNNKKGFLLAEETLKIVVAIICIIFLIYLLGAIYSSNVSSRKMGEATETLSRMNSIISSLEEGESESQDILDPTGWHLYSFVEGEKPNSCLNNNCLCICDNSLLTSQLKKCDDKGVCLEVENLEGPGIDLEIGSDKDFLFVEIKKQDEKIFIKKIK